MYLSCAIFVIAALKKHWVWFAIIVFAIGSVLIVRESLALFRANHARAASREMR